MTQLSAQVPMSIQDASGPVFSDEQLMLLIQSRDIGGLDAMHDRYAALLRVVGMSVLHNEADVDDLLQEVFVEIWNRAADYDPLLGHPAAWITTLTRRRAIDFLRKRGTRSRGEERFAEECRHTGEGWTHIHEELSRADSKKRLERAMAVLPEAQRHVIHLTFQQEMSQRQIRTYTGIPLGTIKSRLHLGLKKMARYLRDFEKLLTVNSLTRKYS